MKTINIPIIPTRPWRIGQLNNLTTAETLEILAKLEKAGRVKRESATILEGGGEYWAATETTGTRSKP